MVILEIDFKFEDFQEALENRKEVYGIMNHEMNMLIYFFVDFLPQGFEKSFFFLVEYVYLLKL